jgi:hypothetical protein
MSISPAVYFVTGRQTVNWRINGTFSYAPLKNGKVTLSGGNYTFGFNQVDEDSRLINSIFSLFYARNFIKFFQKRYIEAANRIDAANGLFITTGIAYEQRNALENKEFYNFFKKKPSPNLPREQLTPMPDNTLTKVAIKLEYTPRYRYRIRDGRKIYAQSKFPTFILNYEKAIPTDNNRSTSFDKLEFSIRQEITIKTFNKLKYFANGGTFLSSNQVYFPDFKHFGCNEAFITTNSLLNTFCMPNYSYSTNKTWAQVHLNYTSLYLLIKNLPFLQKYLFEESLYARTLFVPGINYSEVGYSLSFFSMLEAGVFVGFENIKYKSVGFVLSFALDSFVDL